MNQPKRILICPLDWGLGHATRCIPIIRLLLNKNAEVIIAADGRSLELLKKEFPQLQFIPFKGYEINYSKSERMVLKILFSVPKILKRIKQEHKELNTIIDQYKIDVVISDNRYGCWNKKVKSIFMTHQLMIKAPFGEKLLHYKILKYINNYDECWIPDNEEINNLSSDLAHKYTLPENAFFVGPLSRFLNQENDFSHTFEIVEKYDIMAIISGPEPQRTIFEKIITEQISTTKLKALIVLGLPDKKTTIQENENLKIISHLNSKDMQTAISNSKIILSRSGYSTIMDLAMLGKRAVFVPTPGQTEQEYLSKLFMKKQIAYSQTQSHFNLLDALKESENYSGFLNLNSARLLEQRVEAILFSK